ncbi:MAG TPA: low affinity iron permease family protein [Polyangiaceae bacterium]|nr:low affinity iron permease family protein [Polyangiaceae bacterium]
MRDRLQIDLNGRFPERGDQPAHKKSAKKRANAAQPFPAHPEGRSARPSGGIDDEAAEAGPAEGARASDPTELPVTRPRDFFRRFSHLTSTGVGSPWAFAVASMTIIVWAATGPLFHFSDTWQLVINTGTTIVTFLMVFLIQNTQNRDAIAIHLKLDELIRALKGARNQLVDIEELSDEELEKLRAEFRRLGAGTTKTHPYVRDSDS